MPFRTDEIATLLEAKAGRSLAMIPSTNRTANNAAEDGQDDGIEQSVQDAAGPDHRHEAQMVQLAGKVDWGWISKNLASFKRNVRSTVRDAPVNLSFPPRLLSSLRNMRRSPRKRASTKRVFDRSMVMLCWSVSASWKHDAALRMCSSEASPRKLIVID